MSDEEAPKGELVLFQTEDGRTRVECRFEDGSVWLTQALMAELVQKDVRTINEHLANIYDEGELTREGTIRKFRIVRTEGNRSVSRELEYYHLDAILAVGFRVRSHRGTQFRRWATARLSEYLVKGFTMDDERLKNPPGPGHVDYFDELLERIRDIRASERRRRPASQSRRPGAAGRDGRDGTGSADQRLLQLGAHSSRSAPERHRRADSQEALLSQGHESFPLPLASAPADASRLPPLFGVPALEHRLRGHSPRLPPSASHDACARASHAIGALVRCPVVIPSSSTTAPFGPNTGRGAAKTSRSPQVRQVSR